MAKSNYSAQAFEVEVNNLTVGSTEVKRKALVRFLDVNWESKYVRIVGKVVFYGKNADDTYGAEIKSMGRPEFYITASTQWVNAATGELLNVSNEADIDQFIEYMAEFDFFDMIAATPQNVKELITNYINTAFASGKYDA